MTKNNETKRSERDAPTGAGAPEGGGQRESGGGEQPRLSPEDLRALLEDFPVPLFAKDTRGRYVECNKAFLKCAGRDRDTIAGLRDRDLFPEPFAKAEEEKDAELLKSGGVAQYEVSVVCPKGGEKDVLVHKLAFSAPGGEVAGIAGLLMDISERKRIEAALAEAHEKRGQLLKDVEELGAQFSSVFEAAPSALAIADPREWRLEEVNPAFLGLFGMASREVRGKALRELGLLDPESRKRGRAAMDGGAKAHKEITAGWNRAGKRLHLLWSVQPLRFGDKETHLHSFVDLTEQSRYEEALSESEATFRAITENAQDAIVMSDMDARITLWNKAAERLFGWKEGEIKGQKVHDFLAPECYAEAIRKGFSEFRLTGTGPAMGKTQVVTALRKDGSEFPVEISLGTLRLRGRWAAVAVIRDITDRKRAEQELQRAKWDLERANTLLQGSLEEARKLAREADDANGAKDAFLAAMSHEIRTPMNGVLGMTDLLLDTPLTPEQREYLGIVRDSSEALLRILNDILDFSRIRSGRLEIEKAPFSLRESMGAALRGLAEHGHRKGLELLCRVDPEVPDRISGDRGRLGQVLTNLVGNAVKFTQDGEVTVSVSLLEQRGAEVALKFSVSDAGPGVPEEARGRIFDAFVQGDASTSRVHGGTGLGLAISSNLVALMGGTLGLESGAAQGSTFSFSLDFALAPDGPRAESAAPPSMEGLRTLVVDDHPVNRTVLSETLGRWGARTEAAENGPEALKTLAEASSKGDGFRLVLLDSRMPGMDGLEVAARLNGLALQPRPVVLLLSSGGGGALDAEACRRSGIAARLLKPVTPAILGEVISRHIAGSLQAKAPPPRDPSAKAAHRLRILLAEDNPVNRQIAVRLLERRGHAVTSVSDGEAAVEALSRGAFDLVLMDVQMPGTDGLEATRKIRRRERALGMHAPVLALTAHAMSGDRERCLEAGMDGYLTKPLKASDLYQAIEAYEAAGEGAPVIPCPVRDTTHPKG